MAGWTWKSSKNHSAFCEQDFTFLQVLWRDLIHSSDFYYPSRLFHSFQEMVHRTCHLKNHLALCKQDLTLLQARSTSDFYFNSRLFHSFWANTIKDFNEFSIENITTVMNTPSTNYFTINTGDSLYLKVQGTRQNTSKYQKFEIANLWGHSTFSCMWNFSLQESSQELLNFEMLLIVHCLYILKTSVINARFAHPVLKPIWDTHLSTWHSFSSTSVTFVVYIKERH